MKILSKLFVFLLMLILFAYAGFQVYLKFSPSRTEAASGIGNDILMVDFRSGSFPADSTTLSLELEADELEDLNEFTQLRSVDLSGSTCYEAMFNYASEHPELSVLYTVTLPNGDVIPSNTQELDLSGLSPSLVADTAPLLRYLPALSSVELGDDSNLTIDDVKQFCAECPSVEFSYRFTFWGKSFSTLDEQMILSHISMGDQGESVKNVLPIMSRLKMLDMDSCGVSNESMAAIRDAFPEIKVVWRVWFGDVYTCRTDVTRILASSEAHSIHDWDSEGLYYCTDVIYMDIGHSSLHDLSFLYNMPNLEVLIVACAPWNDATPIGSLSKLEYLEILSTNCDDVSCFANLTNLKHLNLGNCWRIYDITALYGLTQLERLWIGCVTPVPRQQKLTIREMLPNTLINTEVANHKEGGWCKDTMGRNVERYALLREQFGDYKTEVYAYSWSDILYTKSLDELTEDELLLVKP